MTTAHLIELLAKNRVTFWIEKGSLKYRAPRDLIDEKTLSALKMHKEGIFTVLNQKNSPSIIGPSSLNQESMWFIQELRKNLSAYNIAISFKLKERINRSGFSSAFNNLIQTHSQLRTTFFLLKENELSSNCLCQIIPEKLTIPVIYEENELSEIKLHSKILDTYKRPFDLGKGPLIRCSVFNSQLKNPVVLIVAHHSIIDAWSLPLLLKGLFRGLKCHNLQFPVDNCKYLDFSVFQRNLINSQESNKHRNFFKKNLFSDRYTVDIPHDNARTIDSANKGKSFPFIIDKDLFKKSSNLAKQNNVSLSSLYITVYAYVLALEGKSRQFNIGLPVANRNTSRYFDTVGNFINTIALPFKISEDSEFREILKWTHELAHESLKYQELPFSEIVKQVSSYRTDFKSPVFQFFYNYLSQSLLGKVSDLLYAQSNDQNLIIENIRCMPYSLPQQEGQFDLTLEIIERKNYASGQFKYSTSLFREDTIRKISNSFFYILESIILNDKKKYSHLLSPNKQKEHNIVISSTFTAETMKDALQFWSDRLNFPCRFSFTYFDQVFQQLLDPGSLLRQNNSGTNVLLIRLDDWINNNSSEIEEELIETCRTAAENTDADYFIFLCPSDPEKELNKKLQTGLTYCLNKIPGVYCTDSETILTWYPIHSYHDAFRLENGHIPYTQDFFSILATSIIRRIYMLKQKPIKLIASDCDGTLWNGIVAELGYQNIEIDANFKEYHQLLNVQQSSGRLISLISKNDSKDTDLVFEKRGDMVLRRECIVSQRVNWLQKSENLHSIMNELNLSRDSVLFIDDNPVECAEMSKTLPQVLSLQFPDSPNKIPNFIRGLWMLDSVKPTLEDTKRTSFYSEEKERISLHSKISTLEDFIINLQLEVSFNDLNNSNSNRLSQLTYRTNQFNLSLKKFEENDLYNKKGKGSIIRSVSVKDRFGAYGIVGLVIYKMNENKLFIETFLLSCRVLGRGVEFKIIEELVKIAKSCSASKIQFLTNYSDRNTPALQFMDSLYNQCSTASRLDKDYLYKVDELELVSQSFLNIKTDKNETDKEIRSVSFSDNAQTRNIVYYDISQNLSSVDSILSEIQKYINLSKNRTQPISNVINHRPMSSEIVSIENNIHAIWNRILQWFEIDNKISFFDAGGTSLQLPEVLMKINKAFNIELSLIDLFKYTSIQSLALYISRLQKSDPLITENFKSENTQLMQSKRKSVKNRFSKKVGQR